MTDDPKIEVFLDDPQPNLDLKIDRTIDDVVCATCGRLPVDHTPEMILECQRVQGQRRPPTSV